MGIFGVILGATSAFLTEMNMAASIGVILAALSIAIPIILQIILVFQFTEF